MGRRNRGINWTEELMGLKVEELIEIRLEERMN